MVFRRIAPEGTVLHMSDIFQPAYLSNIFIPALLLNFFKASSPLVPKVRAAWQFYSPEPLTSASSSFTTAGFV